VLHGGLGFGFDTRSRLRGGSGVSAVVDATGGYGVGNDPTRDIRVTGEAVGTLAGTDRALILRGYASTVSTLDSAVLPFDELVSPTGAHLMRGFLDGRFRGQSDVVGTLEYRYYIAWDIDATVFSDVGTVAGETWSGLGSAQWFPDFGMGLRFYTPKGRHWEAGPNSGAQVTYAPDYGFRLLFSLAGF
jgi:outer membrane protein assembly factor BamA